MKPLVSFKNVKKHFFSKNGKLQVIDDVSFDVYENEIVALVGPSGSGKSTILNLISNLIKPDSGYVDVNCSFGYMFQKDNLFEWRSVYKNVLLGLEVSGKVTKIDKQYVMDLLNKYGLEEFTNSYPQTLSGGMRQRVALIRTLALKPELLLLDEPFSALDYITRLNLEDDVHKIIRNEKMSAIIVTHDISEAIALSDKVIVISSRPARVIKSIDIEMGDAKRVPTTSRTNPKFREYFNLIYEDLKDEEK